MNFDEPYASRKGCEVELAESSGRGWWRPMYVCCASERPIASIGCDMGLSGPLPPAPPERQPCSPVVLESGLLLLTVLGPAIVLTVRGHTGHAVRGLVQMLPWRWLVHAWPAMASDSSHDGGTRDSQSVEGRDGSRRLLRACMHRSGACRLWGCPDHA